MAIRYQLVNDGENIKNKLYFIVLALFTVSMTATFSVLCVERQYGNIEDHSCLGFVSHGGRTIPIRRFQYLCPPMRPIVDLKKLFGTM